MEKMKIDLTLYLLDRFKHCDILDAVGVFYHGQIDFKNMTIDDFVNFGEAKMKLLQDFHAIQKTAKKLNATNGSVINSKTDNQLKYKIIYNIITSEKSKPKASAENVQIYIPMKYERAKNEWELLKCIMRSSQQLGVKEVEFVNAEFARCVIHS